MRRQKRKCMPVVKLGIGLLLGIIAGSFIPDKFSPLVLFNKKGDKKELGGES